MQSRLIAVVEDDPLVRTATASLIRSAGHWTEGFDCAEAFLREDLARFSCVISDVQMPGLSGLDLLRIVVERGAALPVILMTAFPDPRIERRALTGGACFFLEKPCDPETVVTSLEQAMERHASR